MAVGLVTDTWRRVNFFLSYVRDDDPTYRCLGCQTLPYVGELVVVCRSANERTPNHWGPIEDWVHLRCWELVPPQIRPPLGRKLAVYRKYGEYPWRSRW